MDRTGIALELTKLIYDRQISSEKRNTEDKNIITATSNIYKKIYDSLDWIENK